MDSKKTKAELIAENEAMRHRLETLENRPGNERRGPLALGNEQEFRRLNEEPSVERLTAELREVNEYLHICVEVIDCIPIGINIWKIEEPSDVGSLRLIISNQAADEAARTSLAPFIGTTVRQSFPTILETEFPEVYAEVMRTGCSKTISEFRWPGDDNVPEGIYERTVFPVGENYVATSFENITERKRTEEALRESEERVRAIADSVPVLITYVDKHHRFQFNNKTYEKWFGMEPGEFTGKHLRDALGDEVYEKMLPKLERVLAGEEQIFEMEAAYKSAGKRYVQAHYVPDFGEKQEVKGFYAAIMDLTDRLKAEKELRESERRFKDFAERSSDWFWEMGPDLRFTWFSNRMEEVLGVPPEFLIGKTREELANVEEEPEKLASHLKDLEDRKPFRNFRYWRKGPDGKAQFITTSGTPVFDFVGRFLGYRGTGSDLTHLKRAEDALRESESKYRTLIEQASDGIFITDEKGKYLEVNLRGCELLGCSQEELIHLNVRDFLPPEEMANFKKHNIQLSGGESLIFERPVLRKDGSRYPAEISAKVLGDGRTLAIVRDITERKQAEEALQESEGKFRALLDHSPSAITLKDLDGRYQLVNRQVGLMMGVSEKDIIGKKAKDVFPMAYTKEIVDQEKEVLRNGRTVQFEVEVPLPDGSKIITIATKFPIRDGNNKITGVGTINTDISYRKTLEAQLLQSQKMEALGTLAGGIAHDFNNILTPILGYCEILMKNFDPEKKEHGYLATIFASAQRATDLVSQILLYSRRGQTAKRDCELGSLAKEVTKLVRSTLPKSISVRPRVSADLAPVFCDPSQIHQVFLNLCVNAGQAMPDRGKLGITLGNVELAGLECFAGTILAGNYVRLAVSDSGVGMDAGTLSQIFDPFFTTKEVGVGTGLGLSTVFGIVRDHNGGITVSSEPGEGSTFAVFLPTAKRKRKSRKPQASETKVSKGSETILFVDDDEAIVALGKTALEDHGYNVIVSTDPRQALKKFKANPNRFDLVVTDQGMPHLRGDQLAAKMRKTRADIPIILCTGYSETMTPESSKAIGINAFVYKPIVNQELGRVIRKVLDEAK